MLKLGTFDYSRQLLCGGFVGAMSLCVATAAWPAVGDPPGAVATPTSDPAAAAVAPEGNGYICLSNSCVTQKAVEAPKPAAPATRDMAQFRAEMGARLADMRTRLDEAKARLDAHKNREAVLNSLTAEQRANSRITETVQDGVIREAVEFQDADGTKRSRLLNILPASN